MEGSGQLLGDSPTSGITPLASHLPSHFGLQSVLAQGSVWGPGPRIPPAPSLWWPDRTSAHHSLIHSFNMCYSKIMNADVC